MFSTKSSFISLVLSCLVLSCLVLSCLVLSCLVLSCLVLSCLVLSCLVLSCLVLSCLVLSCLVLSCLVLSFSVFFLCLSLSLSPCDVVCDSACGVCRCVVCCAVVWCVCGTLKTPVCRFKTSPCVPAPRAHVETHVRVVPVHTGTFRTYTRRRFEWTRGGRRGGHR